MKFEITPHATAEECAVYLTKLAEAFDRMRLPDHKPGDWPDGDVIPLRAAAEFLRENTSLQEDLNRLRSLGEVYRKPDNWDYPGMGGGPELEQCELIDLEIY